MKYKNKIKIAEKERRINLNIGIEKFVIKS